MVFFILNFSSDPTIYSQYSISSISQLSTHQSYSSNKPTVMYIFGWLQNSFSIESTLLISAYLKRADHNVIVLDWSDYSVGPLYISMLKISKISRIVARRITKLFVKSMSDRRFHCIGHSFGAHGCGILGREIQEYSNGKFKIGRLKWLNY